MSDYFSEEFEDAAEDSDFEDLDNEEGGPPPQPPPSIVNRHSRHGPEVPERGLYPETRKFLLTKLDTEGGPEAITRENKLLEKIINKYPNELGSDDTPVLIKRVRTCAYHWKANPKLLTAARKNLAKLPLYPAGASSVATSSISSRQSRQTERKKKEQQPPTLPTRTNTDPIMSAKSTNLYNFGSPSRGTPGRGRRKTKANDDGMCLLLLFCFAFLFLRPLSSFSHWLLLLNFLEDEDGWTEVVSITHDMLDPKESVKIGNHLFSLVLNERIEHETLSYIAVTTPPSEITRTKQVKGKMVFDDKDGPTSKLAFSSFDPFTSSLETTVAKLKRTQKEDNSANLCNSLSSVDTSFRNKTGVVSSPIKTTTYDFSAMDIAFTNEYFNKKDPGGWLDKMVLPIFTKHKFLGKEYTHVNAVVIFRIFIDDTNIVVDLPTDNTAADEDDDMNQMMRRMKS